MKITTIEPRSLRAEKNVLDPGVAHMRMRPKTHVAGREGTATKQLGRSSGRREVMGGLAKGLGVILAFTRDRATLTLSDIARITGMPAATARRCLITLEELGYITRRERQFVLRPKVLEFGAAYLESMNIEQLTKTHLEELARITGDSAALCVLDGAYTVYVARASVRTFIRLEAHVGSRFPAHATSTGAYCSAVRASRTWSGISRPPPSRH